MTNLTELRDRKAKLDAEIRAIEARNQDMKSGNVVRAARARLGWTQPEMAEYLGKSLRTVAKWEAEKTIKDRVLVLAMERLLELKGSDGQAPGVA